MVKKILIFSDTHGKNDEMLQVINTIKPDLVIHAGDYCCDLREIENKIDYLVSGNNDFDEVPDDLSFSIDGINFHLTHGHKFIHPFNSCLKNSQLVYEGVNNPKLDVLIYGHSHIETVDKINHTLVINPGSLTWPRNRPHRKAYAYLEITDQKLLNTDFETIIKYL
ncbi:MAG: metallophosphoesterase family protein [Mycoplasmoidaceae bacterium]